MVHKLIKNETEFFNAFGIISNHIQDIVIFLRYNNGIMTSNINHIFKWLEKILVSPCDENIEFGVDLFKNLGESNKNKEKVLFKVMILKIKENKKLIKFHFYLIFEENDEVFKQLLEKIYYNYLHGQTTIQLIFLPIMKLFKQQEKLKNGISKIFSKNNEKYQVFHIETIKE